MQQRIESSPAGRVVLSAFLVLVVAAVVVTGVPGSVVPQGERWARPVVEVTGLDQNWEVFAPDPRRVTVAFEARIEYADGTTTVWRPPDDGPALGTYRRYRWRKWVENVRADAFAGVLWEPTARWLMRMHDAPQRPVRRVTLVRRWVAITRPGTASPEPSWKEEGFYVMESSEV
ncbi:MAG: hypothetical protein KY462_06220 [Actinobacteria bacterium]|nr:hypothetical protein [Actinomycetota bacterium]